MVVVTVTGHGDPHTRPFDVAQERFENMGAAADWIGEMLVAWHEQATKRDPWAHVAITAVETSRV